MQILWFIELEADDIDSHLIQIILTEKLKMTDVPDIRATFTSMLEKRDMLKPAHLVNTPEKLAALLEKSWKTAN